MTSALILASASPARTKLLHDAGIVHRIVVSDVDEDAVTAAAGALSPADTALLLARAKAESVAAGIAEGLVLGCDSVFELAGAAYGKPWEPEVARDRWRMMRGNSGVLHTGHWLIPLAGTGTDDAGAPVGRGEVTSAVVRFEDVTDAEIDAYVATGEPLQVAGAFTIDGLGGWFVEAIEGDHHNVVGLSLPALRGMLAELDHQLADLGYPAG